MIIITRLCNAWVGKLHDQVFLVIDLLFYFFRDIISWFNFASENKTWILVMPLELLDMKISLSLFRCNDEYRESESYLMEANSFFKIKLVEEKVVAQGRKLLH